MNAPWRIASVVVVAGLGLFIAWMTRPRGEVASAPVALPSRAAVSAETPTPAPTPARQVVAEPTSAAQPSAATGERPYVPIERDPRAPGYDAARVYGLRLDGADLLFQSEPRDQAWAGPRETGIAKFALPELQKIDPDVRMETECHTAVCRVRIHSKNKYLSMSFGNFPLTCQTRYVEPDWGDENAADVFSDFYLVFDGETRSEVGFLARQSELCPKYRDDWFREAGAP
jgi:hypothetical protein